MSASRMPWEIPTDVQSHEWAGETCKHCDASRLYVAFFGGACIQKPADRGSDPGDGHTPSFCMCRGIPGCGCLCHQYLRGFGDEPAEQEHGDTP